LLGMLLAVAAFGDDGERSVFADLATVVAEGQAVPVDGISATGQPDTTALKVFAESGYRTVIDLRAPEEDRGIKNYPAVVESSGMRYVSLPIAGADAVNFDSAQALDALLENVDGPVLLHCGSGNRVGALLALRKSLEGADDAQAIEYGKQAGLTGLERRVREVLDAE